MNQYSEIVRVSVSGPHRLLGVLGVFGVVLVCRVYGSTSISTYYLYIFTHDTDSLIHGSVAFVVNRPYR